MTPTPFDRKQRWLVYALGFGCFFQNNVLTPVLPRYALGMGLSLTAVGFILSARSLVPSFFAASVGRLDTRLGARRTIAFSSLLMAVAGLLYLVSDNYWALLAAQISSGTLYLGAWVSAQTYATRVPDRDRVVGVFSTFTALGLAAGPLVGGTVMDLGGYRAAFVAYIVASVALAACGWALKDGVPSAGQAGGAARIPASEILRRPGIQTAFIFSFICLVLISIRSSFVPVYLQDIGFSGTITGLVLAAGSLGQAVLRTFTKDVLERVGIQRLLLLAVAVGIFGLTLMPLTSLTVLLIALAFLHGGGVGLHQSVGLILVAEHTRDSERGYAVGLRATVNQLATAVAPFATGALAQFLGIRPAFYTAGALLCLMAVWMNVSARRTAAFAAEVAATREVASPAD